MTLSLINNIQDEECTKYLCIGFLKENGVGFCCPILSCSALRVSTTVKWSPLYPMERRQLLVAPDISLGEAVLEESSGFKFYFYFFDWQFP